MRILSLRNRLIALVLSIPCALALSAAAQQQTINLGPSAVSLTGPWKFQPGDSPWLRRAAQAHGQSDDITVLTLTFVPAEVLHA